MDVLMRDIDKSFDDSGNRRTIFHKASARFDSGSFCVIVGKSGVGKSSLLNLISGIDLPDTGEIRVGDHCISAMTDTARTLFRRRHIGFIYQFFNLIPVLTVLENVTLIAELDKAPAQKAGPGPGICWNRWGSGTGATIFLKPCPAASSSGWPLSGPW